MKIIAILLVIWFFLCIVLFPARSLIYDGEDVKNLSIWYSNDIDDIGKIVALPAEAFCDIVGILNPDLRDNPYAEERKATYIQWFKDWTVIGWIWTIVENVGG